MGVQRHGPGPDLPHRDWQGLALILIFQLNFKLLVPEPTVVMVVIPVIPLHNSNMVS